MIRVISTGSKVGSMLGLLLMLLALAACGAKEAQGQTRPIDEITVPSETATPASTALPALASAPTMTAGPPPTAEQPPQPLMVTIAPTAAAVTATEIPPSATPATEMPSATPPVTPEASPTPESEPSAPTFTPPPPPAEAVGQHFTLGRPVPPETVAWTDKSYPYGSTKGGALMVHHGVEFAVQSGTPIFAAAAGTVVVAGNDAEVAFGPQPDFYGNLVVLEHPTTEGRPLYTLYGHLSEVTVSVGQAVVAGEQIALSGATGVAFGPHLHFEVRVGSNDYDSTRNPVLWLRPFEGDGVVVARVLWPSGEPAAEVPITLRRLDAPSAYASSASYAAVGVNGDDLVRENFALDDVEAGYYEVIVASGAKRQVLDLWVYPGVLNFIEITLK